jgi:hypothetical protein
MSPDSACGGLSVKIALLRCPLSSSLAPMRSVVEATLISGGVRLLSLLSTVVVAVSGGLRNAHCHSAHYKGSSLRCDPR